MGLKGGLGGKWGGKSTIQGLDPFPCCFPGRDRRRQEDKIIWCLEKKWEQGGGDSEQIPAQIP